MDKEKRKKIITTEEYASLKDLKAYASSLNEGDNITVTPDFLNAIDGVIEFAENVKNKIDAGLLIEIGYCKDCDSFKKTNYGGFCSAGDIGVRPSHKCKYFEPKHGENDYEI